MERKGSEKNRHEGKADQTIHWFPGHMTRTRREIEASIKSVDGVVEILDARVPASSANPDMDWLTKDKPRMIVLNKADLAEEEATRKWAEHFRRRGYAVLIANSKTGNITGAFASAAKVLLADKIQRNAARGMATQIRLMVCGIPNVGKSSFINRLAGGKKAKVEDRPGVTRGKQWFTVSEGIELMDTPGILWPKLGDPTVAERLAFTGAVKDQVLDITALALRLCEFFVDNRPQALTERYKIELIEGEQPIDLLGRIAKKRGMLISGGEPDLDRCAIMLLDELRAGKLGRITFELPLD